MCKKQGPMQTAVEPHGFENHDQTTSHGSLLPFESELKKKKKKIKKKKNTHTLSTSILHFLFSLVISAFLPSLSSSLLLLFLVFAFSFTQPDCQGKFWYLDCF